MLAALQSYNVLRSAVSTVVGDLRALPNSLDERIEITRPFTSGALVYGGRSGLVSFLLEAWANPASIATNIAQWGYQVHMMPFKQFIKSIKENGIKSTLEQIISRMPTYREVLINTYVFIKNILVSTWMRAKTTGKAGFITLALFLVVSSILSSLKRRSYKKYDPNSYSDPRHRPAIVGEVDPRDQEKYHEMQQDLAHERRKLFRVHEGVCGECKLFIQRCTCPTGPATSMMTNFSHQRSKVQDMVHEANKIAQRNVEPWQFEAGRDEFVIEVRNSYLTRFLNSLSAGVYVNWKVHHAILVHDTRPRTEKHIEMGSNRFYIIRQNDLRIVLPLVFREFKLTLPRTCLEFFGIPSRDLVVNEDHMRLQRRGAVTNEVEANLPALLETMLSVPICDPTFLDLGANPLRDAVVVVSAFSKGRVLTQAF